MDRGALEGIAVAFYNQLGFDPSEPVSTFKLARKWLGVDAIVRSTMLRFVGAATFIQEGRRRIAVKSSMPSEYQAHAVGHELAHPLLEREGYRDDDIELACDYLGAALMAPSPSIRALHRSFGHDFEAIAAEVGSTETWAALRLAEVRGLTRLVLTPKKVYVRADDSIVLPPSDRELRALERSRRPGITKVKLHDDPRRTVVDIEDVG